MTLWLLLLAWILASFICAGLWAWVGYKFHKRSCPGANTPLRKRAFS